MTISYIHPDRPTRVSLRKPVSLVKRLVTVRDTRWDEDFISTLSDWRAHWSQVDLNHHKGWPFEARYTLVAE